MGPGQPTPAPEPDDASPRLRYAIENKFPYPVARAFYQLRGLDDWRAEIPQLANVLGMALAHLSIVALAEYLSGTVRDQELNARLLQTFQKPLSHGTWAGVLRDVLTFLHDQEEALFTAQLLESYFPAQGRQQGPSLRAMADELVQLRNDLVKRTTGELPSHDKHQLFKRRLMEFVRSMAFLKDYPLVSVHRTHTQDKVKTHVCQLHVGFHDTFEQISVQCDLDLESTRVAMLNLQATELLYLYPFYVLRECTHTGCGSIHLFCFDRMEKGGIEYTSSAGHHLLDRDAGMDLLALLQSPWSMTLRHKARYLYLESTDTWHQLPPGYKVAGRYEIVEHLRRGGMADVYRVRDRGSSNSNYLAMKVLPFQFLSDRKMMQRFRQEAAQARNLDHSNITPLFDSGEDLVDHYLIMELATGWAMEDGRIALDVGELPKPVDEATAVSIIKQACEGLHYIHRQGIIHRDIKPGNLLLFEEGQVKLADFGIARSRMAMNLTSTGLPMGTPEYMSPEQADGIKELTPASDIYCLGVVLYELLAGKPPFKRTTPWASAYAHVHTSAPDLRALKPDTPSSLQRIAMKCLEKDPNRRFRSALELFQALAAYEQGTEPLGAIYIAAPNLMSVQASEGCIRATWQPISGAHHYQVEVRNGEIQTWETEAPHWQSPPLAPDNYEVRVRAFKGDEPGEWSRAAAVKLLPFIARNPVRPVSRSPGPLPHPQSQPMVSMPPPSMMSPARSSSRWSSVAMPVIVICVLLVAGLVAMQSLSPLASPPPPLALATPTAQAYAQATAWVVRAATVQALLVEATAQFQAQFQAQATGVAFATVQALQAQATERVQAQATNVAFATAQAQATSVAFATAGSLPQLSPTSRAQAISTEGPREASGTPLPASIPTLTSGTTADAIIVSDIVNLREGPGADYPILGSYPSGTLLTVLGKDPGEQWLLVEVGADKGPVGWMSREFLQVNVDLSAIPMLTPTPIKK